MSDVIDERMRKLLREAFPPPGTITGERDLWPELRARIRRARVPVAGLDWLLVAALAGTLMLFPRLIPGLLFHL